MGKHTRLKKLARHLLATTCLTAGAAALANATAITEGVGGAPTDFGNTFGAAYLLPAGTTQVNGVVVAPSDSSDFFTFEDLAGGTAYSFTATSTSGFEVGLELFDGTDTEIGTEKFFNSEGSASGSGTLLVTPAVGSLTFEVLTNNEGNQPYTVKLTATQAASAPEPGTLGAMGLGLVGLAGLARRRKKLV